MSQGGVSILDTCEQRGRYALYKLPYSSPKKIDHFVLLLYALVLPPFRQLAAVHSSNSGSGFWW